MLGTGASQSRIPRHVSALEDVELVACGLGNHCLAITRHGDAWTWGAGAEGQLGHGPEMLCADLPTPRRIEALARRGFAIIPSLSFSCTSR